MLNAVAIVATVRHSWYNFGKRPGPQEEIVTVVFPLVVVSGIQTEIDAIVKHWIESEWPDLSEQPKEIREQFWWNVTSFRAAQKLEVWNG